MSIDNRPVEGDTAAGFEWREVLEADQKEYLIIDSNRGAPKGFGVRVRKDSKTYLIQKKVGGKVLRVNIGNVRDFQHINEARDRAREMIEEAVEEYENPNAVKALREIEAITLGGVIAKYRQHLVTRPNKRAKETTIKDLDKYVRKLGDWVDLRVKDLTSELIIDRFTEDFAKHKTTTEQMFGLCSRAVNYVMSAEELDAANAGREPGLTVNPFKILTLRSMYRTNAQKEVDYAKNGVRNPLKVETQMALWLKVIHEKRRRKSSRLGGDFLLATTFFGTRRNEVKSLKWIEAALPSDRLEIDYVDLGRGVLRLHDTKNRLPHEVPIPEAMLEMFKQRKELVGNSEWVFPARSKNSKVRHYTDSREIQRSAAKDAGFVNFRHHDIRRTFAQVVEGIGLPYTVVKQLINHSDSRDTTRKYTEADIEYLRGAMQRVEDYILSYCPELYNAIKPAGKPPMPVTTTE